MTLIQQFDAMVGGLLNLLLFAVTGTRPVDDAIVTLVAEIGRVCVERNLPYVQLVARGVAEWQRRQTYGDGSGVLPVVTINIKESEDNA